MANRLTKLFWILEDKLSDSKPAAPPDVLTRETRALLERDRDAMYALGEILNTDGYAVLVAELAAVEARAVEQVLSGNQEHFLKRSGVVEGLRMASKTATEILRKGATAQRRLNVADEAAATRQAATIART